MTPLRLISRNLASFAMHCEAVNANSRLLAIAQIGEDQPIAERGYGFDDSQRVRISDPISVQSEQHVATICSHELDILIW